MLHPSRQKLVIWNWSCLEASKECTLEEGRGQELEERAEGERNACLETHSNMFICRQVRDATDVDSANEKFIILRAINESQPLTVSLSDLMQGVPSPVLL